MVQGGLVVYPLITPWATACSVYSHNGLLAGSSVNVCCVEGIA